MPSRHTFNRIQQKRWSYVTLLGLPMAVILLVTALSMAAVQIQSAVRAYELSTSQSASAQAQAVNALLRYARSHTEEDWARFHEGMRMPDSARATRDLLRANGPRALPQVKELLIGAGRHPDDVVAMLRLYRWFGSRFMSPTTRNSWRQTDAQMLSLHQAATQLHEAIQREAKPEEIETILKRIDLLAADMRQTSKTLAASWGQASRATSVVLLIGITLITALMSLVCALLIRRTIRQQNMYTQSLTEAQRLWELASSAAGLGLYQLDATTGAIQLDGPAAALHGLANQPVSLDRAALFALVVEEDATAPHATDEVLRDGQDYRSTYRVRHPDGQVRTLEACGRRISPGEKGAASRLIGVLRDVTDAANQAEQTLHRQAAERVAESQRAFLSRLSHELRTPLNAILGFAQLLKLDERPALTAAQRKQVNWILTAGQQLLALIEDVLDLSKVDAGEITLQLERVDVNALMADCLPLLDAACQQHQVTILNRAEPLPLWAWVDAQRLRQVVINLLSNACKYNCANGHATIDTRQEGDEVVIDISDDGIGMHPDEAAQLFQAFKRVPSAMRHAEGTGLGLYIVKQLVERMQGSVSVISEQGVGTRFTVRLPQSAQGAAESAMTPRAA